MKGSSSVDELGECWTPARDNQRGEPAGFRGNLISDHGLFFPTRYNKGRRTGNVPATFFRDAQSFGLLDAGSPAGFISSMLPSPWSSVFQFSRFLHHYGLEKLGLVDQNRLGL